MKRQTGIFFLIMAIGLLIGFSAISSLAQEGRPAAERKPLPEKHLVFEGEHFPDRSIIEHRFMMQAPEHPHPPAAPGDFIFLATEMSFGGKLVKGAPYSAQAVTESTQVLADGNRIVNKSTATLYRDSEGRTRREQTFRAIGPLASGGDPPQTIFINDPVAEKSYTLDTRSRVARKMPPMHFKFEFKMSPDGKVKGEKPHAENFEFEVEQDVLVDKRAIESGVAMGWLDKRNPSAKTESLGTQNVGGISAEGTRSTVTIPAGEIGNERPIEIVSERWYSPELQTIVMTRHSDPRFGETTYRLTNIDRSEPARALFEVPADYTVKEGPPLPPKPMRPRKPAADKL